MQHFHDNLIPIKNKHFKDLNVLEAGFMINPPENFSTQNTRSVFTIHYVMTGKGYYIVKNKHKFHVKAGQLFIIRPFEEINYFPDPEDPWTYTWISFDGSMAMVFLFMDYVYNFNHLELFLNIKNSLNIHDYREEYLYAQLLLIYRELAPPEEKGNYYVNLIRHQISSSYMTDISVESLAAYCNINRNYATRLFKKEMGMTINQYIIQQRMRKAVEFLQMGYSVENTAYMVGYAEYHSFTKKFKAFFGLPPSKYKNFTQKIDNIVPCHVPDPRGKNPFTLEKNS